jgi:catechol 2,3-dioxygenase-like lactoylglutathione lyase family enzyme
MAQVRYIVHDVEAAVAFYSAALGFCLDRQFGPAMAILSRGDLTLWLAGPTASASRRLPDGRTPEPGGWNRFVLEVDDLDALIDDLRRKGVQFRTEVVSGPGGRQILCEDPSGNPIELFQSA